MIDKVTLRSDGIGFRIREIREHLGWSLEKTAVRVGTSRAHVHTIEKRDIDIRLSMLKNFAHAFCLTLDELVYGEKLPKPSEVLFQEAMDLQLTEELKQALCEEENKQ